jgi:hypothetical protein
LAAEGLDALGQRFVGYRHALPHLVHETVLGHQPPAFAQQQRQGIEIAAAQLDRLTAARQPPVARIEREFAEGEAFLGNFSAKAQVLLMPLMRAGAKVEPLCSTEARA